MPWRGVLVFRQFCKWLAKFDFQDRPRPSGIPTLLLFQKGEVVDRIVGAVPKGAVENSLKKVLG